MVKDGSCEHPNLSGLHGDLTPQFQPLGSFLIEAFGFSAKVRMVNLLLPRILEATNNNQAQPSRKGQAKANYIPMRTLIEFIKE